MANFVQTEPAPVNVRVPLKQTLRIDEAAEILTCSDEHIRHLVEDGSLAAVDVRCAGASRPAHRIVRTSLEEFIQKRKTV